jgi:hypothetical protein
MTAPAIADGSAAAPSTVAGPIATPARVTGVITLGFHGGPRGFVWPAYLIDEAVSLFVSGSVSIIDDHNAADWRAPIVGVIDELERTVAGLRFRGTITDAAMVERLRRDRGAAVSAELRSASRSGGLPATIEYSGDGPPPLLLAVAILPPGTRAGRAGSLVWLEP